MPWLIAESVCAEVSRFLGLALPPRYAVWIEARAEVSYTRFVHFRQLMRGRGNAPHDWFRAFMRHWLASLLGVERPDLFRVFTGHVRAGPSPAASGASAPSLARQWPAVSPALRLESPTCPATPSLALAGETIAGEN